jgi:predicted nucleic-acid-binding protein
MESTKLKSVDTNIILRYILRDDDRQTPVAIKIIATGVFVPITVLLEVGWFLTSQRKFDRRRLAETLLGLIDLPEISVASEESLRAAITVYSKGGDFADAIHLVAARGTDAFITFDKGVRSNEVIGVSVELVG